MPNRPVIRRRMTRALSGETCAVGYQAVNRGLRVASAITLLAVTMLCGLPVVATVYQSRSVDYQCAVVEPVPDAAVLERGASGHFMLWPLGVECRYVNASGRSLTVSPGLFITGLAVVSVVALSAAAAIPIASGLQSARKVRMSRTVK